MPFNYDEFYKDNPQGLGGPTQSFVDFFDGLSNTPLRVLDVGCGQGRDALFIARIGHSVVGVDLSPSGVAEMCAIAKAEGLKIEGIVADITDFTPETECDVVLIDRTLHMLPEQQRLSVLTRLIQHVAPNGWVLIADEKSNMAGFKQVLETDARDWVTILNKKGLLFVQLAEHT